MMMRFADYQGEFNKTELEKKKRESRKKKKENRFKEKTKIKRGQVAHLIWLFVSLLFWSLLVQLLIQTHLLVFVVLFKISGPFQPIIGFHFSP